MKTNRVYILIFVLLCAMTSCGNFSNGSTTPDDAISLISKGLKDGVLFGVLLGIGVLLLMYIISTIISDYQKYYQKYINAGFKKLQSIILSLIRLFLITLPVTFAILAFAITSAIDNLIYGDVLRWGCFVVALCLVGALIIWLLKVMWETSLKNNSISTEDENVTSEDSLMNVADMLAELIGDIFFYITILVVIAIGISYYWFVSKALGRELLSEQFLSSPVTIGPVIFILVFLVAILFGFFINSLLQRLGLGWHNTSLCVDWKKMKILTYFNKPLKKSQCVKGVIVSFFIMGLLPLLVSPFVNSIGLCFFGIVFITVTCINLISVCFFKSQIIKCVNGFFVLDEDQPVDNE